MLGTKFINDCNDQEKLKELYEKHENKYDAESLYWIGCFYKTGKIVTKDVNKAIEYHRKAAELDNSNALVELGELYLNDVNVGVKTEVAKEFFKKAIEIDNNPDAMSLLGYIYRVSYDSKNYLEAKLLFEKAIELDGNDYFPFYQLAMACLDGIFFAKNYQKAIELFEKAIELGSGCAAYRLGNMYHDGVYVDRDLYKAEELYEKSILLGDICCGNYALSKLHTDNFFLVESIKEKHKLKNENLILRHENEMMTQLKTDHRVLTIKYEDHFAHEASIIDHNKRVFEFLGVEPLELISQHKKILPTTITDLVSNYDELAQVLTGSQYEHYLN